MSEREYLRYAVDVFATHADFRSPKTLLRKDTVDVRVIFRLSEVESGTGKDEDERMYDRTLKH